MIRAYGAKGQRMVKARVVIETLLLSKVIRGIIHISNYPTVLSVLTKIVDSKELSMNHYSQIKIQIFVLL